MRTSTSSWATASSMSFEVIEQSLNAARDEAIAVLNQTRRHATDEARFDWLYRGNPDGEAVLWAVRKVATGEMAGFTVALPRRMMVDGQLRTCWNGADFSIRPEFRALGPAIKLRRAAKVGIDAGRADFLYAHPNERMAVIHSKVGHFPVGRMRRYAKVLRSGPYIERKVGNKRVAAAAGTIIDPLVRLAGRESRHRSKLDIAAVSPARFDDRYDRLFEEHTNCSRVVGVRDARYLNWRYAENPLYQTHALEAREGNRLLGYLLFIAESDVLQIKDVFPPGNEAAARDLIAGVIREGRKRRLQSASITTLEGNSLDPLLAEFGFHPRAETSEMFAYAPESSPLRDVVLDAHSWFVTVGDRDV